ncbi:MAG: arylsulfatase [Blastopirellula sp.]|nr:MAG: arylsulfatase [Blastopirellula sp.]
MLRSSWFSAFLSLCVLACGINLTEAKDKDRPNIVLIMADDLGFEALSCNGSTSYDTPQLDKIAANGMRFTHCYSQPVCTPSRNKIMTGRSNARNYKAFGNMDPTEITFGHIMQNAGYQTCIAGKWQLDGGGPGKGSTPKGSGFDQSCMWAYSKNLSQEENEHYKAGIRGTRASNSRFWKPAIIENEKYRPTTMEDFGPDVYTEFIMDFMEDNKREPFFVYFPMALTHSPFIPTPLHSKLTDAEKFQSKAEHFEGMIQYTGVIVQRIIDKTEELGIAENTLIIFTGDNGTGRGLISWMDDRLIMGGKALPIDAGCHVPMIAYWKGKIEPGTVNHNLVDFSDFFPTIAELGNAQIPTDRIIDGHSFLPLLQGSKKNIRDTVILHYDKDPNSSKPKFRRVRFAYNGEYKLYSNGNLFHIPTDWDEQQPISEKKLSKELQNVKTELQTALDQLPAWEPDNSHFNGQADPETQKRLKLMQLNAK